MAKENRFGQASIIEEANYLRLQSKTDNPKWRLFFEIAWHTGERCGAIRQLLVSDVWNLDGSLKESITYRAITRKRNTKGQARTRQVWINDTLRKSLEAYPMPTGKALFFGHDPNQPMSKSNVDKMCRHYFAKSGLFLGGFSTHSFRRSFITRLSEKGTSVPVMQRLTGHQDVRSLLRYVEVNDEVCRAALAAIA